MNSPEFGQLIDILPQFSEILAELIMNAASVSDWETVGRKYYDQWKKNTPFSYFIHSLLREGRQIDPRVSCLIKDAMLKTFTPAERWDIMMKNKLSPSQIVRMLLSSPLEMIGWGMGNVSNVIDILKERPDLLRS